MGHAYAFAYELAERYWDMDLSPEDAFAYRFWQEVVANFIALKVAVKTGTQIGFPIGMSLRQAMEGNSKELAYYCSEAYFVGIIADAPKEFNDLANMEIEKLVLAETITEIFGNKLIIFPINVIIFPKGVVS